MNWLYVILYLILILAQVDLARRLGKANKENKRLQEELTRQVNENLRLQNNFNADSVE